MRRPIRYFALLRRLLAPALPVPTPSWRDAPPAIVAEPIVHRPVEMTRGEAP
ncbi:MAG: hypothetical protein WAP03_21955 [Methylorubrum rhodinum]|uniref:hypothetical protein n=1 Tax=Methylorubrum rhodinum TaxID=29428 RepID=UPI003BAE2FED